MAGFSGGISGDIEGLRAFLFARVYHHPRVARVMQDAELILGDLFRHYFAHEAAMPEAGRKRQRASTTSAAPASLLTSSPARPTATP